MADQIDPRQEPEQKGRTNEEGIVDREDDDEFEDVDDSETQDEEEDLEA
jgi:hypothetical protein